MKELIILTGASRGLGAELLKAFQERDFDILVIGRDQKSIATEIATYIEFDFSAADDLLAVEQFSMQLENLLMQRPFQKLTFINNAGMVQPINLVGNLLAKDVLQSIAVNFTCPALISNICLKISKFKKTDFRVVNISSGAADRPIKGWSTYCSTKAAAKMFLSVQGLEGGSDVFHVDPGVMNTEMQSVIRQAAESRFPDTDLFREFERTGKLKDPFDVAMTIVSEFFDKMS